VALPKEVYKYPEHKTVTVGVPIHANYRPITPALQQEYRNNIGLGEYHKMILITGGGLGARRLNKAVAKILPELLHQYEDLVVVHTVGRGNEKTMNALYQETLTPDEFKRTIVEGYLTDLYKYSGAADLIIARAGATNLAEFAAQGKACIIVPNPQLTGGHQLKNAAYLAAHQAIEIITENDISRNDNLFEQKIRSLLDSQDQRDLLKTNLTTFAQPNASTQIAELLLEPTLKIAHN
jgi:UDP-N-acetylglucosamine--N-acetylmuramyl-(pentapeptide) pyrophosphoryl-undecaprenol N-acetylglucosamine transferase